MTNNTTEASEWSPAELGVSATIMGVYLTVVGLVATVGNATVVLLFILKWRQLCRKAPNLLIINLAAADLCITIFGYPFSASSGYAHKWLFSDAICTHQGQVCLCIGGFQRQEHVLFACGWCSAPGTDVRVQCFLLSMVSMHTLCLISVHRYITICRPEHASQLTMNRTILAVVGAWLYALTMAIPPLFQHYKDDHDTTAQEPRQLLIMTNNTTEASEWSPAELGVSATIMGVYLTVVGLVATVGNATVVLLFILKWRQLCRKAPNLLIINLAAADLCITIFGYPFSASSGYAHKWLFSDAICTMYGFSCFLLSMVSMHTLCLISVHRYITICRPEHASQLTMNRTILAVVGAWLYALTMAIPPLFNITRYKQEPFGLSCTIDFHVTSTADLVYLGVLIVLGYVINVAVMGYCYFKIVRKFSKHRFRDVRDIRTSNQHSFERGVTLRCILMTLLYLISWTPYTALAIWTMVGPPPPVEVGLVAALTAKTHCAFNPILYTLMSEVYRKLVLRTMCPCCFNRIGGNLARAPAEDSRHSGNPDIFTVAYSSREQAVHIRNPRRFCFVMETASENLGIDDEVFTGQIVPCSQLKTQRGGFGRPRSHAAAVSIGK
ncbi:RRH [Branchiostoma lanceolatum]|uniref:RRH protein n=1 Tax=Branchiostoma lanceolatum TaxID=7740 RepID=A0A8J9YN71_BRALA|nr:RRH [Branchiostoma lanceolatum]